MHEGNRGIGEPGVELIEILFVDDLRAQALQQLGVGQFHLEPGLALPQRLFGVHALDEVGGLAGEDVHHAQRAFIRPVRVAPVRGHHA